MNDRLEGLKKQEEKLMELLVENKTEQQMISGGMPAPKQEEPQDTGTKNLIIMIETSKEQIIKIPDNFERLPRTTQRIIMREQARLQESFCLTLKNFTEADGVYCLKTDTEKKPVYTCRGAILEFKNPSPTPMEITAGMELVVRKYRWTKGKVLGSRSFTDMVMKIAMKTNTRLEITNPPKEEDTGGKDTGRLDSNKMGQASKKGFKN